MTSAHERLRSVRRKGRKRAQARQRSRNKTRFRDWSIRLAEGQSGKFFPMHDKNGEPVYDVVTVHRHGTKWREYLCTAGIPGFHGKCLFCLLEEEENEAGLPFDSRNWRIRTSDLRCIGVWDENYYVEVENEDKKTRTVMWRPHRPGIEPPDGAIIGGARYFGLPPTHTQSFEKYASKLAKVCQCVTKTRDADERSVCYYKSARCPDCNCVVYNQQALDAMDDGETIDQEVFMKAKECLDAQEGGCWTDQKREEDEEIFLTPEWGCAEFDLRVRGQDSLCTAPRPITPFDGPCVVGRTGTGTDTLYTFDRVEVPWERWLDMRPPEEALSAFADGIDFRTKFTALSLGKQCEEIGCPWPTDWDEESKAYKSELTGRKQKSRERS